MKENDASASSLANRAADTSFLLIKKGAEHGSCKRAIRNG